MKAKTTLVVLVALQFAGAAHAAKCKFEVQEADHVESRRLVLFRGATVGLLGYFGVKNGEHYLRGLFGSNFKGRATFNADTPLVLTLANDRTVTLDVVTAAISSKLKFGRIITVAREAEPVFSVTPAQWSTLQESPIVRLHMSFNVEGERQSELREVKSKHARRIMDGITCVSQERGASSEAEDAP